MRCLSLLASHALLIGLASAAAAAPDEDAAPPDAAPWQASFPARPASDEPIVKTSQYVTMRDGTRLAVDVYRPQGDDPAVRLPTLLNMTRYWRAAAAKADPVGSCRAIPGFPAYFAARGYAVVVVDVRGTGASFGSRSGELDANEFADQPQILDWIVAQPWSNGTIGATGISYGGTVAEYLVMHRHPALKAVAPVSTLIDAYANLYFPGGVPNKVFRDGWSDLNRTLDAGRTPERPEMAAYSHPCPVDGDDSRALLGKAVAEHKENFDSGAATRGIRHRDESDVFTVHLPSSYQHRAVIDAVDLPFLTIDGWFDSGYARAALDRLASSRSRNLRAIIAPTSHGLGFFSAPGLREPRLSGFDANAEILAFFDHYLMGHANGYAALPRVRWFTTGVDIWQSAERWADNEARLTLCVAGDRTLRRHGRCGIKGSLGYRPKADAALGPMTRWDATITGGPVLYPERSAADRSLLTFDTLPLERDLHITGVPVLELAVTSTAPRADIFAYLEEVEPDGKAHIIADGMVRANYAPARNPAYPSIAYQPSGRTQDEITSIAGEPVRIMIAFEPLSHVVSSGKRLRLTLAGQDRAHFDSSNPAGTRWRIATGDEATRLVLPASGRD